MADATKTLKNARTGICQFGIANVLEAGRECVEYTDKKENLIFLLCKEIQSGAEQLQSHAYMTNGLLIYGEIFAHLLIY